MAPRSSNDEGGRGRLFLTFTIRNHEPNPVHVESVMVTVFGPSNQVSNSSTRILDMKVAKIAPATTAKVPHDHLVFDLPASRIQLAFRCTGFAEDTVATYDLAAHAPPVADGAYRFPARATDLFPGESWYTNGCFHPFGHGVEEGDNFGQAFAYDLWVVGVSYDPDHETSSNPALRIGTSGQENDHYRAWGKQVCAMADGLVVEVLNDVPDNPKPITASDQNERDKQSKEQRDKYWGSFPKGAGGNHVVIQHGDGQSGYQYTTYAHMQKGSVTVARDMQLKAGDVLGVVGNSGNSSMPHLHIQAVKASNEFVPLPMVLRRTSAIDSGLLMGSEPQGFWSRLEKQGIPEGNPDEQFKGTCCIWPDGTDPEWPEVVVLSVPESDYQQIFDKMGARGLRPCWFAGHTFDKFFFHQTIIPAVFRPGMGVRREFRHGLTGAEYQGAESLSGRHVTDRQMRSYMTLRQTVCIRPAPRCAVGLRAGARVSTLLMVLEQLL